MRFRRPLCLLGFVCHLAQFPDPLGHHRRQLPCLVEAAEGRSRGQIQLDAVGLIAGEQLLENRKPFLPHRGVQEIEAHLVDIPGSRVGIFSDMELGVVHGEGRPSAQAFVFFPGPPLQTDPGTGNHQDPCLVTAVHQDLEGVMAVLDELPQYPSRPIPDIMGPLLDLRSPELSHLAVVEHGAPFNAGEIDKGVHTAAGELVDDEGVIGRGHRGFETVQVRGVTPVIEKEDPRLPGGPGVLG